MCPAVGQGALAIETRDDGGHAQQVARSLNHSPTQIAVTAERALLAVLGGGCQVPIGAHATVSGQDIQLRAIVSSPDGTRVIRGELSGTDASSLGQRLGEQLLKDGAREILSAIYPA
jgi:hydroxymethylbilane synthase